MIAEFLGIDFDDLDDRAFVSSNEILDANTTLDFDYVDSGLCAVEDLRESFEVFHAQNLLVRRFYPIEVTLGMD
jgi:hypothetical protein